MTGLLAALLAALEASWPPETAEPLGGWRRRRAPGGGSRVNSARWLRSAGPGGADLAALRAADGAQTVIQAPCRVERESDRFEPLWPSLAAEEAAGRWRRYDETLFLSAPITAATPPPPPKMVVEMRSAVAAFDALWTEGDGGPARRAIMARAAATLGAGRAKELAARLDDRFAGAGFGALAPAGADPALWVHAVHVAPWARRRGAARFLVGAFAAWAAGAGAGALHAAVVTTNAPSRALFAGFGAEIVGGYAYFRAVEE